jgi:hypothetical protein
MNGDETPDDRLRDEIYSALEDGALSPIEIRDATLIPLDKVRKLINHEWFTRNPISGRVSIALKRKHDQHGEEKEA